MLSSVRISATGNDGRANVRTEFDRSDTGDAELGAANEIDHSQPGSEMRCPHLAGVTRRAVLPRRLTRVSLATRRRSVDERSIEARLGVEAPRSAPPEVTATAVIIGPTPLMRGCISERGDSKPTYCASRLSLVIKR